MYMYVYLDQLQKKLELIPAIRKDIADLQHTTRTVIAHVNCIEAKCNFYFLLQPQNYHYMEAVKN